MATFRNLVSGEEFSAGLRATVNHSASSYGQPVLLVGGDAVDAASVGGLVLVEGTRREKMLWRKFGGAIEEQAQLLLRLPVSVVERLHELAQGRPLSQVVADLVRKAT